ncbi:MAG: hypothetical protein KGI80_05230, partial [Verrucomicrobiota bacterium]|nr:hypothetical protein [Verrucomicrobiota bacterium]
MKLYLAQQLSSLLSDPHKAAELLTCLVLESLVDAGDIFYFDPMFYSGIPKQDEELTTGLWSQEENMM